MTASGAVAARLDRMSEGRFATLLAAPGLILVALFVVPPVLAAIGLSFFRIELLRDDITPFVGLRNYATRLPMDAEYLATLGLTVGFAIVTTIVAVPIALATALLVVRRSRFGGVLGLLLLLPWAVAPIASGLFWAAMFDAREGLLNHALVAVGLPPVLLREAGGTLIATLVAVTWRAIPLLGIIFLGALRQVPANLQRAARLDGATAIQVFRHVTLPAIAPALIVACALQIILTLQVFDVQFALTSDAPPPGSRLAGLAIFDTVIGQISLGYGAAKTVVLGILIAICLALLYLLVLRPSREVVDDDEDGPLPRPGVASARSPIDRTRWAPAHLRARRTPPIASVLGRRLGPIVRGLALVVLAVWLAGPVVWIAVASTQPERALVVFPPQLTTRLELDGYAAVLSRQEWREAALVSVTVTVMATLLALVVAALTAYPLARYRLRGSRPILLFLLGTQLIPPIALAIPVLLIFLTLDLRNTVAGLILINAAFWSPILVWLLRAAFLAVPRQLEQAARIDGCSRLGAIFRLSLPAAAPAITAAAAIVFVGIWNDFVFAAMLGGRDTHTLPRYLGESANPLLHVLAAKIVLTVAPCVVIVSLFWRRIFRLF
jgi:multiple sugar transport system permease protein